jgi:uncharacterized BrkB/YihY/UPF0761 family membrane protein
MRGALEQTLEDVARALCYRLLPGTAVPWRSAWKGALVASLALHMWFQVAACLLLFGACVTAVSCERARTLAT